MQILGEKSRRQKSVRVNDSEKLFIFRLTLPLVL